MAPTISQGPRYTVISRGVRSNSFLDSGGASEEFEGNKQWAAKVKGVGLAREDAGNGSHYIVA